MKPVPAHTGTPSSVRNRPDRSASRDSRQRRPRPFRWGELCRATRRDGQTCLNRGMWLPSLGRRGRCSWHTPPMLVGNGVRLLFDYWSDNVGGWGGVQFVQEHRQRRAR